jgi:hypothetical protein
MRTIMMKGTCTYIDATDWKTARLTATMPTLVGSEKWAASIGLGPRL